MARCSISKKLMQIGGVCFGIFSMVITPETQIARAGQPESTDRNSQCAGVSSTTSPTQTINLPMLAPEPKNDLLIDEDVNIVTGLYTRSYSRQQNGVIDYKAARQIVTSEYNEYWNTVVQTKEFPLLYWEDGNQDGEFDMWVDQQGDGFPCDMIPYHIQDNQQQTQMAGF